MKRGLIQLFIIFFLFFIVFILSINLISASILSNAVKNIKTWSEKIREIFAFSSEKLKGELGELYTTSGGGYYGYGCTDSDGGNAPGVRGTATGNNGACTDSCISTLLLNECICSGENSVSVQVNCPAGQTCSIGACVASGCTDSDGGIIINIFGTTTGSNGIFSDSCLTLTSIKEYYCSGSKVVYTAKSCGIGGVCKNGACCTKQCSGKNCGPDSCGGTCGTCSATTPFCNPLGTCVQCLENSQCPPTTPFCNPSGKCVATCQNACTTIGPISCSGTTYTECGYFNYDTCLDKRTRTCLLGCDTVTKRCKDCYPESCLSLGKECGKWPDGCGGEVDCGNNCFDGEKIGTCESNGKCVCVPFTCVQLGKNCGKVSDGCGGELNCGTPGPGEECGSNGIRISACANECNLGEKQCAGSNMQQICGNYDFDSCLEWGDAVLCRSDSTCNEATGNCGECSCENRVCGNDGCGKSCGECGYNERCDPYGQCIPDYGCTSECNPGETKCINGKYQECGDMNNDNCFEWGKEYDCQNGCDSQEKKCCSNEYVPNTLNPVAFYTFENNANDLSGYGNNGIVSEAIYTSGKIGKAISFDGINDRVRIENSIPTNLIKDYTITGWFKLNSLNDYQFIISRNSANGVASKTSQYSIYTKAGALRIDIGNGAGYQSASSGPININQWTFFAFVLDSSNNMQFYINGVKSGTSGILTLNPVRTNNFFIGIGDTTNFGAFNGAIDELKIWNSALNSGEILNEYNRKECIKNCLGKRCGDDGCSGTCGTCSGANPKCTGTGICVQCLINSDCPSGKVCSNGICDDYIIDPSIVLYHAYEDNADDLSGNGNNGIVNGAVYTTGKKGKALVFDGVDDNVNVSNSTSLDITGPVTIAAWIKPGLGMTGGAYYDIVEKNSIYVNGYGLEIYGSKNNIEFWTRGASFKPVYWNYGSLASIAGNWYHVVGVFDGTDNLIYINGELKNKLAGVSPSSNNEILRIGGPKGIGKYFIGTIDEVKIWNKALSANEIIKEYTGKECIKNCFGKQCGEDGCGGTCGTCSEIAPKCSRFGDCVECSGNNDCTNGKLCDLISGRCVNFIPDESSCMKVCNPNCVKFGRECGSDGCEGSCGECSGGKTCDETSGRCKCTSDEQCDDSKSCTDDSCDLESGKCLNIENCLIGKCFENGQFCGACRYSSECDDFDPCTVDQCFGGICGNYAQICGAGETCYNGACIKGTGSLLLFLPFEHEHVLKTAPIEKLSEDFSSYNNHGSCIGLHCPTLTTGKINNVNAYNFDGVYNNIIVGDKSSFIGDDTSLTVSFFVKYNSGQVYGRYYKEIVRLGKNNMFIRSATDGKIEWPLKTNWLTTSGKVYSSLPLAENTWYHVLGTYDSVTGVQRLYINGVLQGSRTLSTNKPKLAQTKADSIIIGGSDGLNPGWAYNMVGFNGQIDEVKVWNKVLTTAEITAEVNGGAAKTCDQLDKYCGSWPNGKGGTVSCNAACPKGDKEVCDAVLTNGECKKKDPILNLDFQGDARSGVIEDRSENKNNLILFAGASVDRQALHITSDDSHNSYAALKKDPINGQSSFTLEAFISRMDNNPATIFKNVLKINSNGYAEFTLSTDQGTQTITSTTALPINSNIHIAAVYNGKEISLYVGGVKAASAPVSGIVTSVMNIIGGDNSNINIDDVQGFNRALSESEIKDDSGEGRTCDKKCSDCREDITCYGGSCTYYTICTIFPCGDDGCGETCRTCPAGRYGEPTECVEVRINGAKSRNCEFKYELDMSKTCKGLTCSGTGTKINDDAIASANREIPIGGLPNSYDPDISWDDSFYRDSTSYFFGDMIWGQYPSNKWYFYGLGELECKDGAFVNERTPGCGASSECKAGEVCAFGRTGSLNYPVGTCDVCEPHCYRWAGGAGFVPSECGPDYCGGTCGTCASDAYCYDGICLPTGGNPGDGGGGSNCGVCTNGELIDGNCVSIINIGGTNYNLFPCPEGYIYNLERSRCECEKDDLLDPSDGKCRCPPGTSFSGTREPKDLFQCDCPEGTTKMWGGTYSTYDSYRSSIKCVQNKDPIELCVEPTYDYLYPWSLDQCYLSMSGPGTYRCQDSVYTISEKNSKGDVYVTNINYGRGFGNVGYLPAILHLYYAEEDVCSTYVPGYLKEYWDNYEDMIGHSYLNIRASAKIKECDTLHYNCFQTFKNNEDKAAFTGCKEDAQNSEACVYVRDINTNPNHQDKPKYCDPPKRYCSEDRKSVITDYQDCNSNACETTSEIYDCGDEVCVVDMDCGPDPTDYCRWSNAFCGSPQKCQETSTGTSTPTGTGDIPTSTESDLPSCPVCTGCEIRSDQDVYDVTISGDTETLYIKKGEGYKGYFEIENDKDYEVEAILYLEKFVQNNPEYKNIRVATSDYAGFKLLDSIVIVPSRQFVGDGSGDGYYINGNAKIYYEITPQENRILNVRYDRFHVDTNYPYMVNVEDLITKSCVDYQKAQEKSKVRETFDVTNDKNYEMLVIIADDSEFININYNNIVIGRNKVNALFLGGFFLMPGETAVVAFDIILPNKNIIQDKHIGKINVIKQKWPLDVILAPDSEDAIKVTIQKNNIFDILGAEKEKLLEVKISKYVSSGEVTCLPKTGGACEDDKGKCTSGDRCYQGSCVGLDDAIKCNKCSKCGVYDYSIGIKENGKTDIKTYNKNAGTFPINWRSEIKNTYSAEKIRVSIIENSNIHGDVNIEIPTGESKIIKSSIDVNDNLENINAVNARIIELIELSDGGYEEGEPFEVKLADITYHKNTGDEKYKCGEYFDATNDPCTPSENSLQDILKGPLSPTIGFSPDGEGCALSDDSERCISDTNALCIQGQCEILKCVVQSDCGVGQVCNNGYCEKNFVDDNVIGLDCAKTTSVFSSQESCTDGSCTASCTKNCLECSCKINEERECVPEIEEPACVSTGEETVGGITSRKISINIFNPSTLSQEIQFMREIESIIDSEKNIDKLLDEGLAEFQNGNIDNAYGIWKMAREYLEQMKSQYSQNKFLVQILAYRERYIKFLENFVKKDVIAIEEFANSGALLWNIDAVSNVRDENKLDAINLLNIFYRRDDILVAESFKELAKLTKPSPELIITYYYTGAMDNPEGDFRYRNNYDFGGPYLSKLVGGATTDAQRILKSEENCHNAVMYFYELSKNSDQYVSERGFLGFIDTLFLCEKSLTALQELKKKDANPVFLNYLKLKKVNLLLTIKAAAENNIELMEAQLQEKDLAVYERMQLRVKDACKTVLKAFGSATGRQPYIPDQPDHERQIAEGLIKINNLKKAVKGIDLLIEKIDKNENIFDVINSIPGCDSGSVTSLKGSFLDYIKNFVLKIFGKEAELTGFVIGDTTVCTYRHIEMVEALKLPDVANIVNNGNSVDASFMLGKIIGPSYNGYMTCQYKIKDIIPAPDQVALTESLLWDASSGTTTLHYPPLKLLINTGGICYGNNLDSRTAIRRFFEDSLPYTLFEGYAIGKVGGFIGGFFKEQETLATVWRSATKANTAKNLGLEMRTLVYMNEHYERLANAYMNSLTKRGTQAIGNDMRFLLSPGGPQVNEARVLEIARLLKGNDAEALAGYFAQIQSGTGITNVRMLMTASEDVTKSGQGILLVENPSEVANTVSKIENAISEGKLNGYSRVQGTNEFIAPNNRRIFIGSSDDTLARWSDVSLLSAKEAQFASGDVAAAEAAATGGCFLADTKIKMADGTFKNIQDIKEGEKVSAYDIPGNKPGTAEITKTFVRNENEYYEIEYEVKE